MRIPVSPTSLRWYSRHSPYIAALVLGLGIALPSAAADKPFDIDAGNWTAFENYKQTGKENGAQKLPPPENAAPESEPLAEETVSEAPPVSLFLTPAMPGLNKGYDIKIDSTEQGHAKALPRPKTTAAPDFQLPDKNWESPGSLKMTPKAQDDGEESPLNVRLSFLPSQSIVAVPHADPTSARKLGHEEQRKRLSQKRPNDAGKTPEVAAACEAMDLYKKQQLDALQSDRETLMALQNAIHSLGLSKELGYMTGEQTPSVWQTPAPPAQ